MFLIAENVEIMIFWNIYGEIVINGIYLGKI